MIDYTNSTHVIEDATGKKKRARYERRSDGAWKVHVLDPFEDRHGIVQDNPTFGLIFFEHETSDYGLTLVPPADDEPEDWACVRAFDVTFPDDADLHEKNKIEWAMDSPVSIRFALYIQSKEDPPEDPLRQMARDVVADQHKADGMPNAARDYRDGYADGDFASPASALSIALAALKRAQKEWCGK